MFPDGIHAEIVDDSETGVGGGPYEEAHRML